MDSHEVKAFFERVSLEWDDMRSSFYNADIIDVLADRTDVDQTSTVVDVGTGTGTGTGFVAAGLAGRVASVIGVDNSPAMMAVARQSRDALGADNVTLVEGEVDALPLEDDSVDVAVASMVLDLGRGLRHHRYLRCLGEGAHPPLSSVDVGVPNAQAGCRPDQATRSR